MNTSRTGATATVLPNGEVLIAGGIDKNNKILDTAELYNPTADTFTFTIGAMTSPRWAHTASLQVGKVLLIGGRVNSSAMTSAEVFDLHTGRFTATGSMAIRRNSHTATILANGKVLVLGGHASLFSQSSGELYDSVSGSFISAGNLTTPRELHRYPASQRQGTGHWRS
jgi:Galactose oxidase, central domain